MQIANCKLQNVKSVPQYTNQQMVKSDGLTVIHFDILILQFAMPFIYSSRICIWGYFRYTFQIG